MSTAVFTLALGAWLVLGVFADGWAHFTVPNLESFFTPWHGALYSGLAAVVGWFALLALPGWRAGRSLVGALPQGYQQGAAGAGLFGLGGIGEMAWHLVFGVETGIDALLSPTAGLSVAVVDFPAAATAGALGAGIGALLADLLIAQTAPAEHRWTLPVTAAVVILAVWSGQLTGLALTAGLGWPVELWSGVILLSAAVAGLLGALAATPRVRRAITSSAGGSW